MNKIQRSLAIIVFVLFEAYAGYRLLTSPAEFSNSLVVVFGVVMLVIGAISLYWALTLKSLALPHTLTLVCAVIDLIIGVVFVAFSQKVVGAFPTFAKVIGVIMVITGISKLRDYLALQVLGLPRRILWLISAILTIVLGVFIFLYPYAAVETAWVYGGYFMIASATVDLVLFLLSLGAIG